jgi:lipoprotein-releasing system permease protein
VGTVALIIVLSAFNGLESLVNGFYNTFDPDLKVTPATGKYFKADESKLRQLSQLKGVSAVSTVLEERVLFTYRDMEHIGSIKGVDASYSAVTRIRSAVGHGEYAVFPEKQVPRAVLGAGVAYYLGYGRISFEDPINVFVPKSGASTSDFSSAFSSELVYPGGVFNIQPEFDEKYVITSLSFVQGLLGRSGGLSSIEIKVDSQSSRNEVQQAVADLFGDTFEVKNREEQQAVFLKVMKTESLFTFLVFALILAIASFTIMGSLSMMMLDKKEHLRTLWAMGAELKTMRAIFFKEGLLISLVGAGLGVLIGVSVVLVQQHFGLLQIGQNYVVEAYPVELQLDDILLVILTVAVLCGITSWLTSRRLTLKLLA